jgi:FtsZ-binding cell division protein ZapB
MEASSGQQVDSLARLEERIHQAAELVASLRRERDAAVREAAEARALASKVSQEVDTLRGERGEVRKRIEKLLGQMDELNAG